MVNYYDIQKKLGVEVTLRERMQHFYVRIRNIATVYPEFDEDFGVNLIYADELFKICQEAGFDIDAFKYTGSMEMGFRVAAILQNVCRFYEGLVKEYYSDDSEYNELFIEFLGVLSVLMQSEYFKKRALLREGIREGLIECRLPYRLVDDIIQPIGADELDKALVDNVLVWLKEYPKAYTTYKRALIGYFEKDYPRDIADNLRKALEEFLQEYLNNDKNLANNISEVGKYLESKVNSDTKNTVTSYIARYNDIDNRNVKHHDKLKETELEYLLYQTGVFIRFLVQVRRADTAIQ